MSHLIKSALLPCMLIFALTIGCSDDDENNAAGPDNSTNDSPDVSSLQLEIPSAMQSASSGNAGAAQAVGYFQIVNTLSIWSAWITPPPAKLSSVNDNIVWAVGGITVTLTTTVEGDQITWTVTVDGSDGELTYDNFVLFRGYQSTNGDSGSFSIFAPEVVGQALMTWEWMTGENMAVTVTMTSHVDGFVLVAVSNPDGSGSIRATDGSTAVFYAEWGADGGGTFIVYDGQGVESDSGSWSA